MKNIKKIIAIVLCLLFVISSVATVSAEESGFSGIVSKEFKVGENGEVEILIDLAGNPGITALILAVSYDSEVLTLKENGFTDTGLLVGNVQTTINRNPFRLSWQHSDATAVNNYKNGTIAKLVFEAKEDFVGSTEVVVTYVSAQTIVDDVFVRPPAMESGIMTVTKDQLAIKDGVVTAKSMNGETLIVASYNKDRMMDCKVYPNSTGNVEISLADVLDTNGVTKFKAFLWENSETLVPACNFAEEMRNQ